MSWNPCGAGVNYYRMCDELNNCRSVNNPGSGCVKQGDECVTCNRGTVGGGDDDPPHEPVLERRAELRANEFTYQTAAIIGSPSAEMRRAGLQTGDAILRIDGKPYSAETELRKLRKPGPHRLQVRRDSEQKIFTVEIIAG